jgi:hypothetical protein
MMKRPLRKRLLLAATIVLAAVGLAHGAVRFQESRLQPFQIVDGSQREVLFLPSLDDPLLPFDQHSHRRQRPTSLDASRVTSGSRARACGRRA